MRDLEGVCDEGFKPTWMIIAIAIARSVAALPASQIVEVGNKYDIFGLSFVISISYQMPLMHAQVA